VLAEPHLMVQRRQEEVTELTRRARHTMRHLLDRAASDLEHTRARVLALSPAATLKRGYAVLQREDGHAVRAADEVRGGEPLLARVAEGSFQVTVAGQDAPRDEPAD
jgi:exodeoxyribonuclease VII large subunit